MKIDLTKHNYVLVRENDNKQILGRDVKFVEWNEMGSCKEIHETPAIGMSIVVDMRVGNYKWLTTQITEIVSETKFRTKNSVYNLYKL